MNTKILYAKAYAKDFLVRLRDIRFAGQVAFVVIVLLTSWSGVKAIWLNYHLEKEISTAQQQNEVASLQNEDLKLQNVYFQSKQYLDIESRQDFGLAAPGEQEILVPKSVAMSYAPNVAPLSSQAPKIKVPSIQTNLQAWYRFLFQ